MLKGVDGRINEGKENDRIMKRIYVGECAGICSVAMMWKRWIDTVKDCLRKRGLYVRQARRMVQDGNEWWEFAWSETWRMNP